MVNGYVEETTIITMSFSGRRKGLIIWTQEPSADTWEKDIVPLLEEADKPLKFIDVFVRQLDSWNLKRKDGTSVPANRAGLMSMNIRFVTAVIKAWLNNGILVVEESDGAAPPPTDDIEEDPFADVNIRAIDMDVFTPEEVPA